MKRNALIKMKDHNNEDSVIITDGYVRNENDAFYIEYKTESDEFVIGICDDIVTISKLGNESYTMVLKQDDTRTFGVQTAYGSLEMCITPTLIKYEATETGLKLLTKYKIYPPQSDEEAVKFELDINCTYTN